tara:strand:+ start:90803 stop:91057 length:255 start_codon:yes stop_codon:yes gene_type:complete
MSDGSEKRTLLSEIEKVHWQHKGECDSCGRDYQDGFVLTVDDSYHLSLCQSCGQGYWDRNEPISMVAVKTNPQSYSPFYKSELM